MTREAAGREILWAYGRQELLERQRASAETGQHDTTAKTSEVGRGARTRAEGEESGRAEGVQYIQ